MTDTTEGAGSTLSAPSRPVPGRRAAFVRAQRRRSMAIAAASTATVVVAIVLVVPRMPGWDKVRQQFFDADTFREALPELLGPFWLNIRLFVICAPCIVVVGLLIAMARNARTPALYPLRLFATVYTDVVRGVPVILWISLIGFGVPGLFQERAWYTKLIVWASVALVMCYSAYVAEVFRAGIESVHESQRAAARSLGLTSGQTMRSVVLPQAVRRMVPALMNDFVSLQKDVALVSVVGIVEVLRKANNIKAEIFNSTPVVAAALLFLCVSIPLTRFTDHLLARERRRTSGTAVA
jgi:polar amino acid transport system permease protein